ncbi:MAG TPA: ABC transporter permease [Tissierellales bacterium]|nr:ABC transporter permease [Tissierellales bacterium]
MIINDMEDLKKLDLDIKEDSFELVQVEETLKDEKFKGEPIGFLKDAWIRFKESKPSMISAIIIAIIVIMSIVGPMINPYTYRQQHVELSLMPPRIPGLEKMGIADGIKEVRADKANLEARYGDSIVEVLGEETVTHQGKETTMVKAKVDMYKHKEAKDAYFWFGTDSIGRDIWTRLWRGTRVSLFIGVMSVLINLIIGVVYGAISGYFGGWTDMIMQRILEILTGIPELVVIILLIMYMGEGVVPFIIALVMTGWIGMSRMIRAQFYRYKGMEYVLASRTMGAKDRTLIFRHILPNAIGPTVTQATLAIPSAIFAESQLSYLGLGLQAPEPSIGVLLSEGQKVLLNYPHLIFFPAIIISVLMLAFNLFGNGLRDAFDPTLRGQ